MTASETFVRSRRVLTSQGLRPATIAIREGRIVEICAYDSVSGGLPVRDAGDRVVMAGLVDTHVHINEPGRASWEGFETATGAAAAGGVTTLVDMPLNSIPATVSLQGLEAKRRAAAGRCRVDVGFWGGAVPTNCDHLKPLWEAGVLGFKAFLCPSGVEEFPAVGAGELDRALAVTADLEAPLLVHAELPSALAAPGKTYEALAKDALRSYHSYLASRPPAAEVEAIRRVVELASKHGARVHVVHLASTEALPLLREARRSGTAITAETCPHYLQFAAESISEGDTRFKCAPPIRGSQNREGLWRALADGEIDLVASDHSPSPPALKQLESGNFRAAWGGIASLQLLLPALWTGARRRGHTVSDLGRWLSAAPARLAGLGNRKGALLPGRDADLVIWEPDSSFIVDPRLLYHRHPVTPYAGLELFGVVRATMLRGVVVYDAEAPPAERLAGDPLGSLLLR